MEKHLAHRPGSHKDGLPLWGTWLCRSRVCSAALSHGGASGLDPGEWTL